MDNAKGSDPGRERARHAVLSIKAMMIAVACFGAIFWAVHHARETMRPAVGLARTVRSGTVADRRDAVMELGKVGPDQTGIAIPALIEALEDGDEEVRSWAAIGLGSLVRVAVAAGPGFDPDPLVAAL